MSTTKPAALRLACRVEGSMWNVYVARPDTMEGATLVGSIAMRFIEESEDRKLAFLELLKEGLAEGINHIVGGEVLSWDTTPAPDSERAGHG